MLAYVQKIFIIIITGCHNQWQKIMRKIFSVFFLFVFFGCVVFAQMPNFVFDSTMNNLKLPAGYTTSEYEAIPEYVKRGSGEQAMILIPGWGFDNSVFEDFMMANEKNYTMYAITIPGYGTTKAPPILDSNVSYGEQYWNNGVLRGVAKLIEKENVKNPIVVGSFVQGTQLALRMGIEYGEIIQGVIILGGPVRFIPVGRGDPKQYTLEKRISGIDNYMGPKWFKTITKKSFEDGNYPPGLYSTDSVRAQELWHQSASVSLPVMVQYLCEFFASDISLEMEKLQCPVLVLRGSYDDSLLAKQTNNYIKPQFIEAWDEIAQQQPLVTVKDIQGAASFVWKDKPEEVYREIKQFVDGIEKGRR
ncbi:MAG: alpha/beta hydrolase [Bacteroidetes bacterium]|nr:MAG: alpha/beta hydrolase [Bacteroidota bacterium]